MAEASCFHCGDKITTSVIYDLKSFCCTGCKTVYEILSQHGLHAYYDLEKSPGASPVNSPSKFDFLDNEKIIEQLVSFNEADLQIISLFIPHIHCSSCIWILENLSSIRNEIITSQVDFPKKMLQVSFNPKHLKLKDLVIFLGSLGYEPYISLNDQQAERKKINKDIIYKIGVSGFAFGNVMFLSFPEYFEIQEYWLDQYKSLFRWLMFGFSIPVVFYVARDYFISAFKGLKSGFLNIDVPLALGILVLFIRSTLEIIFDWGSGFFDSLTGLVFFLTLGKFFQQKTYDFLSFERDYKSYFPIGVTRINPDGKEESVHVQDIVKGDRILIRHEELLPVDGILISNRARIDYSFVTGEAQAMEKQEGEKLFAGGRQVDGLIEIMAIETLSQSYLTQLRSNAVFSNKKEDHITYLINKISKWFTLTLLFIAVTASFYWILQDVDTAINVFTAVLIIACPCALAMATPFTLGNLLRIFGKNKFYLKNAGVIEQLAAADAIIFDKTGTLTTGQKHHIHFYGTALNAKEESFLWNVLRSSNHPLSRTLYEFLGPFTILPPEQFFEYPGQGITAKGQDLSIKIGAAHFVKGSIANTSKNTAVHVSINECYKGKFVFQNEYRAGLMEVFDQLTPHYELAIISGDNDGERSYLKQILPKKTELFFHQQPQQKLDYISKKQAEGRKTIMVGDGLNDAGALAKSEVGIAISENVNVFSPACDAILDASRFDQLFQFVKASKKAIVVIKISMLLSFIYNIVGLSFAVTGHLTPLVAAVLMPLSSISIIAFTTLCTNIIGRSLGKMDSKNSNKL